MAVKLVADAIRLLEVLRLPRFVARLDQARIHVGMRRPNCLRLTLHAAQSGCRSPEKPRKLSAARRAIPMAGAMQSMQLGDGLRRVQIVRQRIEHRPGTPVAGVLAFEIAIPLPQRLMRLVETDQGPVQRLAVMRPEHVEAQRLAGPE